MEEYLQESTSTADMLDVCLWKWNEKYESLNEFVPVSMEMETVLQSIYKVLEDTKQQEYVIVKVLDEKGIDGEVDSKN